MLKPSDPSLSDTKGHRHLPGEPIGPSQRLVFEHGASFPSVARLSRVGRWPSGWNVDRQKQDYEDKDRIECDFRHVETPTPPLLHSLLVHS
jgi:hypothetical protein